MSGRLTTHVLDTMRGIPAAGMAIALWSVSPEHQKIHLKTAITNEDGRTDEPMLIEDALEMGVYELVFEVGDYFAQIDPTLPYPPFLDRVPIQFGIAHPKMHYHVPLLVSPWSYSTYRGS